MTNDNNKGKIYGLLGRRIDYSLSPVMHNAAFRHFNVPAEYKIFNVEQPEDLDRFFRDRVLSCEISGFNVTVPYKIRMKEMLEKCGSRETDLSDKWVGRAGAVNTVKVGAGRITAYNTDMPGFGDSLYEDLGYDLKSGNKIFVIGAGGAGRAICLYLAFSLGASGKIYVYDVEKKQLDSLQQIFNSHVDDYNPRVLCPVELEKDIPGRIRECDLVVNATPLGTREGDPLPIDPCLLREGMMVYDLVYCRETELLKAAREKGLSAAGGLGMLVNQGALAFNIWTGNPLDETKKVMMDALTEAQGKG